MKVAVERYFSSLNHLNDETRYLLTDFVTPQKELAYKCEEQLKYRGLELEQHGL